MTPFVIISQNSDKNSQNKTNVNTNKELFLFLSLIHDVFPDANYILGFGLERH
jgi:hypothetical protein